MLSRAEVLKEVLALPPVDQASVADVLEQNLSADTVPAPGVAEAWSAEIDRRIAAWDRGDATAIDFDWALEHLRQSIAGHRQRQTAQ